MARQIAAVVGHHQVGVRVGIARPVGLAIPAPIQRKRVEAVGQQRHELAPQPPVAWEAVDQQHRKASPDAVVRQAPAVDVCELWAHALTCRAPRTSSARIGYRSGQTPVTSATAFAIAATMPQLAPSPMGLMPDAVSGGSSTIWSGGRSATLGSL